MKPSTPFNLFKPSRRQFLQVATLGLYAASTLPSRLFAASKVASDPWDDADRNIANLTEPHFAARDFVVTSFGAKPCELTKIKALINHEDHAEIDTPTQSAPDCYAAFNEAIIACHNQGGGRVVIPAGNWYCAGPIVLLSNVHVHLQAGAQIYFSQHPADYAKYGDVDCGANGRLVKSRWQSNDCLNFCPMVYANGQKNIALTGEDWTSILNGQGGVPMNEAGECWWSWKHKWDGKSEHRASENAINPLNPTSITDVAPTLSPLQQQLIQDPRARWRTDFGYLPALSESDVPLQKRVFGLGHYLRPPMVQFIDCDQVLMSNYQTTNTPFWQHHPVNCKNVIARHIYTNSLGPNSDGFDPDACQNVLIEHCTFNTGDDCIAIKSGKNNDIQFGASKHMVIQHCTMQSGHGALTLGSEMSGGIEAIYARHLVFENKNWQTNPLFTAIRIKTNMNRGGYVKHCYISDISIPNGVCTDAKFYKPLDNSPAELRHVATGAGAIITIDCDYMPQEDNVRNRAPQVTDIHIQNVQVGNVATPNGMMSAYQAIVIQGPVVESFNGTLATTTILPVSDISISNCDFGTVAHLTQPIYLYNAKNIHLQQVKIGRTLFEGNFKHSIDGKNHV